MKVIMTCVNIKLWDLLGCFHYILNAPRKYSLLWIYIVVFALLLVTNQAEVILPFMTNRIQNIVLSRLQINDKLYSDMRFQKMNLTLAYLFFKKAHYRS